MAQLPNMNWMGDQPTGSAYDVYQYYLGGGSPGGTTPTSGGGGGGITSLPWYQQTGGGNDGYKGGGKWGNLDLSKGKMFDKNVFSTDMVSGPPSLHQKMTGSFKPEQVQGYYNPTLGAYQTLEGKNINHLGINAKPIFASMLESMGVGGKKNKLFDHELGAIEGTFTHGLDSGKDKIKKGWEDEKDKWSKIFGSKKSKAKKEKELKKHVAALELKEKEKQKRKDDAAKAAAKHTAPQHHQDVSRNRGDHQAQSFRSEKAEGIDTKGSGMHGGKHYAEGGMITDFNKDPEYRGWKKMYEANPELGSMHNKHPTFIKFYKKYERDQKKFGGLAGLLYG